MIQNSILLGGEANIAAVYTTSDVFLFGICSLWVIDLPVVQMFVM
jgi:hypothetical protein